MEQMREKNKILAARIYELDQEVYKLVGSNLGSVFNGGREKTIDDLAIHLTLHPQSHILRSEIALIGNMARTIRDKDEKARLLDEHKAILDEIATIPSSFGTVDVKDTEMAQLNLNHMKPEDHVVICISRSHGSAGTDIGFALAEDLKINYYDEAVLNSIIEREEHDQLEASSKLAKDIHDFSRYHGLPKKDAMFFRQSEIICELARQEDMIIIGRCADAVLTGQRIPHLSIYITAPLPVRIRHMMNLKNMDLRSALRRIRKSDHQHESYYNSFTGKKWGNANNYDLCINSACYGIEESVELIKGLIDQSRISG